MVATSSASTSLKDYLKKYTSNDEEKKKKKRKKRTKTDNAGVLVVDEDPVWQKPVKPVEEEEDSAEEEKPLVDEDIEVKRMKRLEQLKSKRPFGAISEDGSGWVSVPMKSDNQDSDISPPRERRHRNDTPSPNAEEQYDVPANADLSPPRKHDAHVKISNSSGGRKARHDTPSPDPYLEPSESGRVVADLSPPRRQGRENLLASADPDRKVSYPRSSESNMSPPKRAYRGSDYEVDRQPSSEADLSPPRKVKNDRSDLSPPRKRNAEMKITSSSSGQRARHDTPSPDSRRDPSESERVVTDLSPPRRQRREKPVTSPKLERKYSYPRSRDSDISPPRRANRGSNSRDDHRPSTTADISPPRKLKNARSNPNFSSRNSNHELDDLDTSDLAPTISDLSPPRKKKGPALVVQQPKTGLVSGKDIKEEIDKKKKEDWLRFKGMDPTVSGRDAEVTYRNKITGERMSREDFLKSQKKEEKPKEIKLEWGKGLAQKREAEARLQEIQAEKDMPFARTRDDPDLDRMLKERVRFGDPMAHLVKKKQLEPVLPDLGDSEKMKASGFIIPQEVPSHSWIRRGLDAAPNRYGIKPGRHWDGVDRSNGYEKELFKRTSEKRATEREAYLWSVSDM